VVSVIVPVYNVEPYLRECLDSVIGQTIGFERIELIAIDDGSTDGSDRVLDAYAADSTMTVRHEPNSGGAGRPRNIGLDLATGRYVFFLDADDYLGTDALRLLVDMAERNDADIVVGRMVPIGGRRLSSIAFPRSTDHADLERVYLSGSVQKLFRRSLIERLGLRFEEGIPRFEDGLFMARIYHEAGTVSVVGDYDCYFIRRRPGSQSRPDGARHDLGEDIARLESGQMAVVARHRGPGVRRDILMAKHIERLARLFDRRWRSLDPTERRRTFELGDAVLTRWHTSLIDRVLPAWAAVRVYCLQRGLLAELEDIAACPPRVAFGDPIVEHGRIFARYPHFRDASRIPDRCFDITHQVVPVDRLRMAAVVDDTVRLSGEAYLTLVGGVTSVEVRRWPSGPALRIPTTVVATPGLRDAVVRHPAAGFDVALDVSRLPPRLRRPGFCSLHLSIGTDAIRRTTPLRASRSIAAGTQARRSAEAAGEIGVAVTPAGTLRLRIGRPGHVCSLLEQMDTAWSAVCTVAQRALVRGVLATRAGRMIELAVDGLRPGLGVHFRQE
jgi:CDP-glycerol glycerophosphotransferase